MGPATVADQQLNGTIQDVNPDIYVYYQATGKPVTPVDPGNPGTPVTTGTVTVHDQTAAGDGLIANDTFSGPVGQPYTTTAKAISGYQVVTTSGAADGVYTATNQDVYYIYRPVNTQVAGGGDQGKPTTGGAAGQVTPPSQTPVKSLATRTTNLSAGRGVQITTGHATVTNSSVLKTKTPAKSTTKVLPQTDERPVSAWWGITLLAVLGSIFGLNRRKRY